MQNKVFICAAFANIIPLTTLMAASEESTPNVIYIMADDLGIGDLGCYGQKFIKTPAIDQLAADGIMFTQHYAGSTVSAPSRCSLLTGKHTGNAYIRGNHGAKGSDGEVYDHPLAAGEITVADVLKQRKYVTACIGKWGLGGPGSVGAPDKHGFDYFYGHLGQLHAHKYYPPFLWENDKKISLDGTMYSHDLIINKALDFIDKNSEKPFFIYLTPTIPHAELIAEEADMANYDGKFAETPYSGTHYCSQSKPRATYAAMVSRLDKDVRRIMDLLESKGISENTIVIFTSDNGVHAEGGHDPYFFKSSGPFRGIKRDLYEGGIRVPLIVNWPAKIAKGSVAYHLSAFWDFLPTICELIKVQEPIGIDGISYLPSLTREGEQKRHEYLYWEFHEGGGKRAVLKDNWKLIELFVNKANQRRYELYNISSDPGELADVSKQMPYMVETLKPYLNSSHTKNAVWNFVEK